MSFKDTASFGKRQEYVAVAELLKRGFDVYMTLVDDQGIDCIIRLDQKRYIDVQIKARSKTAQHWNFFPAMKFKPRNNLFYIFYMEKTDVFWVMPSKVVAKMSIQNKNGLNKGKYSLTFPKRLEGPKAERFVPFKDDAGFKLIKSFKLYN